MDDFEKRMVRAVEMHKRLSKIRVPELDMEEINRRTEQIAARVAADFKRPVSDENLEERLTRIEIKRGLKPPPPPE